MRYRVASSSIGTAVTTVPLIQQRPSSSSKKNRKSLSPLSPHQNARSPTKNNHRPASPSKSPAHKRHKPEQRVVTIPYPTVPFPTKIMIESLYQSAIAVSAASHQNQLDEAGSGFLSLEQVLLPAVAQQEVNALKKLQSKAQRDGDSDRVCLLKACRAAVYQSVASGVHGANRARMEREKQEAALLKQEEEERLIQRKQRKQLQKKEKEQRRQERAQARKEQREQQKTQQKKAHPTNVQLRREGMVLFTEVSRLEKEEKLWKQAQEELTARQQKMDNQEQDEAGDGDVSMEEAEETQEETEYRNLKEAIQGIVLSSKRIQQALGIVSDVMREADTIQKDVCQKYGEDHLFHGYRGVKDPKGLLRAIAFSETPPVFRERES